MKYEVKSESVQYTLSSFIVAAFILAVARAHGSLQS